MATVTSHSNFSYVSDVTITVGSVTGSSSKTVTYTLPGYLTSTQIPVVIAPTLTDAGLGIGNAWLSSPTNSGTTLNVTIINSASTQTPASDPIVFKVAVL